MCVYRCRGCFSYLPKIESEHIQKQLLVFANNIPHHSHNTCLFFSCGVEFNCVLGSTVAPRRNFCFTLYFHFIAYNDVIEKNYFRCGALHHHTFVPECQHPPQILNRHNFHLKKIVWKKIHRFKPDSLRTRFERNKRTSTLFVNRTFSANRFYTNTVHVLLQ